MENLKSYAENMCQNKVLVVAWAIIILVMVFLIFYQTKVYTELKSELFEVRNMSAPVPSQRSAEVIGVGTNLTYAQEDSGTNRGSNNPFTESVYPSPITADRTTMTDLLLNDVMHGISN